MEPRNDQRAGALANGLVVVDLMSKKSARRVGVWAGY